MKLRYYAILLSLLAVVDIIILALSTKGVPITKVSISRIGGFEGNYVFFFIGTAVLIIMFSLFLHRAYKQLGYKPGIEVYLISVISIIGLMFKAGNTYDFKRIMHSILFLITSLIILYVIFDLNKKYIEKKRKITKRINTLPKIAFLGTIAVFLLIGMNVITEIIYLAAVLSWVNVVGFSS